MAYGQSAPCPDCGMPIAGEPGISTSCPNCGITGTITQGIEVPQAVFWGGIGIIIGIVLAKSKTVGAQLSKY